MWQRMLQVGSGNVLPTYFKIVYENIKQPFNQNTISNSYTVPEDGFYIVFSAFGHFISGSPDIECSTAEEIFDQSAEVTSGSFRSTRIKQFKCTVGDIITVSNPSGTHGNNDPSSFSTIILKVNFKINSLLLLKISAENTAITETVTTSDNALCIAFSCGNGTVSTSLSGTEIKVDRNTNYCIGTMEPSLITIGANGSGAWTTNVVLVARI